MTYRIVERRGRWEVEAQRGGGWAALCWCGSAADARHILRALTRMAGEAVVKSRR